MAATPPIRTHHARHGRMSADARRVLRELGPRHAPARRPPGRPTVLEIGCGFGDAAVAFAREHADLDVVAVDVHRPGIVSLLRRLEEDPVPNLWVDCVDALVLLGLDRSASAADGTAPLSGPLAGVHAFFPDPWPKTRHRKRRLIRPDVIDRLATLVTPGGAIRVATDVADYATTARRTLDEHPAFDGGVVTRPSWRPVAGYEAKAVAAGRRVVDLAYHRRT